MKKETQTQNQKVSSLEPPHGPYVLVTKLDTKDGKPVQVVEEVLTFDNLSSTRTRYL